MNGKKKFLIGLVLILLLAALLAGLYLIRQQQLVGKKAAIPTGTATISLNPETKTVAPGTSFPVQIAFTTAGLPISAVTVDLSYPYTGTEPPITVTNVQLNASLLATGEWSVPFKSFPAENGVQKIKIAAVNTSLGGYTATTETVLGSIIFQGNSPGTITVTFNATESKITVKSTGQDNLLTPASTGVYTVQGVSASPTPTTGVLPSATPRPTSGQATPTPPPSGLTCASLDIPGGTSRSTNEQVRFVCNGNPSSLVTSCRFRFGDGSAESLDDDCNIFHTYATTGSFDVSCEVRDTAGSFKASSACGNRMTITAAAAATPTPPGGSTGQPAPPESGSPLPTILLLVIGVALLVVGARVALPIR